jgi:hypothetical protein
MRQHVQGHDIAVKQYTGGVWPEKQISSEGAAMGCRSGVHKTKSGEACDGGSRVNIFLMEDPRFIM